MSAVKPIQLTQPADVISKANDAFAGQQLFVANLKTIQLLFFGRRMISNAAVDGCPIPAIREE